MIFLKNEARLVEVMSMLRYLHPLIPTTSIYYGEYEKFSEPDLPETFFISW